MKCDEGISEVNVGNNSYHNGDSFKVDKGTSISWSCTFNEDYQELSGCSGTQIINNDFEINCVSERKEGLPEQERIEYKEVDLGSAGIWTANNYGTNSITDYGEYVSSQKYNESKSWNGFKVPSGWTIPTWKDFETLWNNTTREWTEDYQNSGVPGMIFKANDNDNELFFPAGGRVGNTSGNNLYFGTEGFYWSKTWDNTGAPLYVEGWKVLELSSTYLKSLQFDKTTGHKCLFKFKKN